MGLREMKKLKVRQAIQRETLRLFEERGYRETTVEEIAAAAEVSTTTFYRYYSSKEDVILSGVHERGPAGSPAAEGPAAPLHFAGAGLPEGGSLLAGLRVMLDGVRASGAFDEDRAELLARLRMINQVPELRALNAQRTQEGLRELARMLAGPDGADGYETRVLAAAIGGAVAETLRFWVDQDGEPDLAGLFDRTLTLLAPAVERASR
ncbi:TetR/AcrR family transcriptional regulator [Streptomyces sp. NPDC059533]|uniref:TetR/AcrR family transcriptional regulator n=2 Tax=unclassified Streptomyces TaxID=2593676 RepID=UPI0036D153B2